MRGQLLLLAVLSLAGLAEEPFIGALFPIAPAKAKPNLAWRDQVRVAVRAAGDVQPLIDGKLDEACWGDAPALALTQRKLSSSAVALLLAGKENLYVACLCPLPPGAFEGQAPEKMAQILDELSSATHRDLNVWMDEGIEIFLDPGRSKQDYYQFIINTLNTQMDGEGRTTGWNGNWQSAVFMAPLGQETPLAPALARRSDLGALAKTQRLYWTCEIAIPYAALQAQAPQPGQSWGLNIIHNCKLRNQHASFACMQISNHEPQSFGQIAFVAQLPVVQFSGDWSLDPPALGANQVLAHLSSADAALEAQLRTADGKSQTLKAERSGNQVRVPFLLNEPGTYELLLSARGVESDRALFVFQVNPPLQPLMLKLDQREYWISEPVVRAKVFLTELAAGAEQEVSFTLLREGRELRRGQTKLRGRGYEVELKTADLPAGAYTLKVQAGTQQQSGTWQRSVGPFDAP